MLNFSLETGYLLGIQYWDYRRIKLSRDQRKKSFNWTSSMNSINGGLFTKKDVIKKWSQKYLMGKMMLGSFWGIRGTDDYYVPYLFGTIGFPRSHCLHENFTRVVLMSRIQWSRRFFHGRKKWGNVESIHKSTRTKILGLPFCSIVFDHILREKKQ